ncbi:MAG: tetratricopeptide repeat protein [Lawsonibacter sp.]|jgi:hypothetical protein|nr:tetratricopeptide repeat protein [Lawsonibacter sp.]
MKQVGVVFLTLSMVLCLVACGQNTEEQWQEQYDLGIRYLEEGNYEEAIIAFTAAIEIDPKQASAYMGRGDAYIKSGETEENLSLAQMDYEHAIELDETNVDAYLGLADVYIRQGDYEKALKILQQGRRNTGENQQIVERTEAIINQVASNAVDVFLNHEDMWGKYATEEVAFSGTNTLRFMDLDFDGSPELVIESPTNGSGAFTNRYIFQRQSENIERVNESFDLGSGWDEISLMRDRETGEYFYLGFDHFQDGAIMGFDLWAKLAMRDGQLEGTRLFSHGWDEPLDSYYGSGSEPITQEEFERIKAKFDDSTENADGWISESIPWDSSVSYNEKHAALVTLYCAASARDYE